VHAPPVSIDIRTLGRADVEPALGVLERAFGGAPHPEDAPVEMSVVDPARFYGAYDGAQAVGTAGSFDFTMTVPGGPLPVAGVTWVGVLPTHRRRGILDALMARQLTDLHDAGTAVAALWATEAGIYGRYGYAPSAWMLDVRLPRGAAFRRPVEPGPLRLVDAASAEVREVYAAVAARTAGWPARDDAWWGFRLHDPEHRRDGGSPLQCVLTDDGYALYSTAMRWEEARPAGTVRVRELAAATPAAAARLWRYLLDLDLMREVQVFAAAPDDRLLLDLLAEPRVASAKLRDCLHVRLVDVAAALAGRRYAADVDVVLEVGPDRHCPWNTGRWHLVGGREGAACTPTSDEPDLVVTVQDLGAAYLGGTPLRGKPVEERTPGQLSRASTALGPLDGAPWCPQVF
jgi:predicted acetyltransferase